ncbi:MAG: 50S ribosomal protein L35 [Candidatus Omnitrophica bacterium]|nr:50S ribosomal protein L35 [Candidatus Omnitrophota bacterium]MBU4488071.1 50S ribosomal protein L35 [Candidatus Omnitrophota bacterium]MCG2704861.1 50S ribosomal protein L35 [Candidatus Omnitrophota bacterium]
MPKLKTRKAVAKRFKITKWGKVKRMQAGKSHILTKKEKKRKRHLRHGVLVSSAFARNIKRQLPYG